MNIPFRVKKLTDTAKLPEKANEGDLWDIFADDFCIEYLNDLTTKEIIDGKFDNCYAGNKIERYCDVTNISDEYLGSQLSDVIITGDTAIAFNNNNGSIDLFPQGRILIKTGIALELPIRYTLSLPSKVGIYTLNGIVEDWFHEDDKRLIGQGVNSLRRGLNAHAVADLRPRSGLALKHGITVLNAPGTIDNSYRKEIGVILYNAGHKPYTIKKGDKIAQMLIRPLYPSQMEVVEEIEDTTRGGYGSTGK